MDKPSRVELNWNIEPDDFVPFEITRNENGYSFRIFAGKASCEIDCSILEPDNELFQIIETKIISSLRSVQIIFNRNYVISAMSRRDHSCEGNVTVHLQAVSISAGAPSIGKPILTQVDEKGNVIPDPEFERKKKRQEKLAIALEEFQNDKTLIFILNSYSLSFQDPKKSLSHLYDIREALQSIFNSQEELLNNLRITKADWRYIGQKCNSDPYVEGRHVGFLHKNLQHVPKEELETVRQIALCLIENYIIYLNEIQ